MSERETVVELPFAANCYPWVEKLRTVLPLTAGLRDGAVQLAWKGVRCGQASSKCIRGAQVLSAADVGHVDDGQDIPRQQRVLVRAPQAGCVSPEELR